MESASLKIKFTPLIKKLHTDDAKCYLEIVPEVACLQNFDKIRWQQENNLYEYVIPMTYKIILKKCKKYDAKCTDCNHHQVYHSCVDLLHTSATNSVDASGDVNRIFSETVLLNKVKVDMQKTCDMIMSELNFRPKDKPTVSAQTYEQKHEFLLVGGNNSNIKKRTDSTIIGHDRETQNCAMNNFDVQVLSFENIMNLVKECVERSTRDRTDNNNRCASDSLTVGGVNPIYAKTHVDNKRMLSQTPICSVNTEDSLQASQHENICYPNPIMLYDDNGYYRDIYPFDYLTPINNPNLYAGYMYFDYYNPLELYKNTPEARIANFMRTLEEEILPLKCMLNNIVSKYTSLNIDAKLFKSLLNTKQANKIEESESQKKQKSNRVIYTLVFDG